MKRCIVNYITENAWHPFGQKRLGESLTKYNYTGGRLFLTNKTFNCVPHNVVPYAFKLYIINEAIKKGYTSILWVDASFWAIREVDSLFTLLEEKGILLQSSGHNVGNWSSDTSLEHLGVDREIAMNIPAFSGGFIGIDITNEKAVSFFDLFYKEAEKGIAFKGPWKNKNNIISKDIRVHGHRHDMVVGSIIADKLKIPIYPDNSFFSYYKWHNDYKKTKDLSHIYFLCEGGNRKI